VITSYLDQKTHQISGSMAVRNNCAVVQPFLHQETSIQCDMLAAANTFVKEDIRPA